MFLIASGRLRALLVLLCALPSLCVSPPVLAERAQKRMRPARVVKKVYLQVDRTLPGWVTQRFSDLLSVKGSTPVEVISADHMPKKIERGALVFAIGDTAAAKRVLSQNERGKLGALKEDGYLLSTKKVDGVDYVVADGRAAQFNGKEINRGALYAAYAGLEQMGFAFTHPLAPIIPKTLSAPTADGQKSESPRWKNRGLHIHTMHPLELTNLLNGFGKKGIKDQAGFDKMLGEWRSTMEWLLANRQNQVQWVLLASQAWQDFALSDERAKRLSQIVDISHEYGIAAGLDVGIGLRQQHMFRLLDGKVIDKKTDAQLEQIRSRVDYLMKTGIDHLGLELGQSEFTKLDPKRTVDWLDNISAHIKKSYDKELHVKIHVSSGQTAEGFNDPRSGEPINYNFLPHFADRHVGVLPHTVQHYALDDPAPTYGNKNFNEIREFMRMQGGRRQVLWHPESAYWVSYDIDVPLFLPVYTHRRLQDLRLIRKDEDAGLIGRGKYAGSKIDGQLLFSSGWEWGYWLNDVATMRAAYSPPDPNASLEKAFRDAMKPILRVVGDKAKKRLENALWNIADDQHRLLILGEVDGKRPHTIDKRSGQAYLQGWDTFDDLGALSKWIPGLPKIQAQPARRGPEVRGNKLGEPDVAEIRPLLDAMATRFEAHRKELQGIAKDVAPDGVGLINELVDAAHVTELRAKQMRALYEFAAISDKAGTSRKRPKGKAKRALAQARKALDEAQKVVERRQEHYRLPLERVAGWDANNPTAYSFGYLWTVKNLHYFWRDEYRARFRPLINGHMNLYRGTDVMSDGEGALARASDVIAKLLRAIGLNKLVESFRGLEHEPTYPPAGMRDSE
jgi:hypothetical protein